MENKTHSTNIQKISKFLKDAGIFYLLTTEGTQPKGRPFAFHMVKNNTIYFATVTFKDVYKQMKENPLVEITATMGSEFIRYDGIAVFDEDQSLVEKVLEIMPEIKELYKDRSDFTLAVFHIEKGNVEIRNMTKIVDMFEVQ